MFSVKARMAWVSVLALVLSAFVPLQTAPATAVDATFTKTFTVLGTDGNPYAGAQVALVGFDDLNHEMSLSTPVTTNSSGVAVVTVPLTSNYYGYSVQPPVTDTTTALYTSRFNGISKSDESISVNLIAANLRLNIVNSNGSNAAAGAFVTIPSAMVQNRMKTTVTVRSGATAVAVSTTIAAGNYEISIGAKADLSTPSRFYAMEVSGSGSGATRTLHVNDQVSSAVLSPNAGLYTLQLPAEQIRGTLKTFANAAVTLPAGVKARIQVAPYNDQGGLDFDHAGAESSLFNADGTFNFALPTTKPGRYNVRVVISGSAEFPSFTGPDIWINAAGNYSLTDGNYASAASFVYDLRLPQQAPNFVLELKNADGSAASSGIWVYDIDHDGAWMGVGGAPNGLASYSFADGHYVAQIQYFDSNEVAPFGEIGITVTNGIATVRNQQTPIAATSGSTWTFSSTVPNLNLRVVDPSNSSALVPAVSIEVFTTGGNYVQGTWSNDGFGRLTVADGTYQLRINTPDNATFAQRNFNLTVEGNSITLQEENDTPVPVSGGQFVVSPFLSNAIFRVVSPTDSTVRVNESNIDLRIPNGEHVAGAGSYDQDLGFVIPEGVFEISVNPGGSGYASQTYSVTRAGNTITVTNRDGVVIAPANGVFLVSPSNPNIKFKVAQPGSQNAFINSAWLDVMDFNSQQWVARGDTRSGLAGLNLPNGKYNVRVNPGNEVPGLAENTYVVEMISGQPTVKTQAGVTIQANGDGIFIIEPKSANVTLNIKHPTTQAALLYSYVQVFQLDEARNFRDWVTFGNAQDGTASISLPDGNYGIEVQAGGSGDSSLAQNRYELTVSGGVPTVLKTWAGDVLAPVSGSYVVSPKAANLLLKVVNPDAPTQILRGSYVNLRDTRNQWLPGGGVNNLGQVGLNVEDGTYTLEVNPGGQASGLASKTYSVVVSNSGANVVVSSGSTALVKDSATSVFTVSAASANIKFKIVDPADGITLLEQADASLFRANGNQRGDWIAHSHGGTPGFAQGNGNYIVEIQAQGENDEFANEFYKVNVAGGVVTVSTIADVAITAVNNVFAVSPAAANVSLTVINPTTNAPIYSSWVEVFDRSTNRWISGTGSNRGNVSLNLPQGNYSVKVNPGGAGNLAAKSYDLDVSAGGVATVTGAPVADGRIQLAVAAANVLLKVVSPTNQSKLLLYANVSVQNASDNMWITGVGGNTGNLALRLEDGTYNLQVDAGNVVDELLARKTYSVTVSNSGSSVAISNSANQAVAAVSGVFTLTAALPAITGVVQAPDADAQNGFVPVPNSWVEPFNVDTGENMWQNSSGSNSEGRFGIAVPDGDYTLSAQVPWNSGYNLAKSASCAVTVASGAITTSVGGCVVSVSGQKSVQLNLRAPNLSFIVADADGIALPNAHVSLFFGAWHVWANANEEGRVSLFVDPAEIAAKNPGVTGSVHLRANIEPPYGNTASVRTECSNGAAGTLCAKLPQINLSNTSTPFAVLSEIGTVRLQAPNTRVTVVGPDNVAVGQGAWVTLFKDGQNGNREWIAGSNSGVTGQAVFNVTDQTGTFTIEVNAPHGKRGQFASKTYSALSFADLNGSSRALATPNLKLKVQQPTLQNGTNKAAKWSWVNIERINELFNPTGWVPGSSTDDLGLASSFLDADGNYRLTVYPGGGSVGARTICDVRVAAGVVSLIDGRCAAGAVSEHGFTITLSRGNVTGTITAVDSVTPLAGAIVVAERVDDTLPDQQFTTGVDGTYGFQLAQGDWNIKVYYVNEPDTNLAPDLVGTVKSVGQVDVVHNKNLAVAP